MAKAIVTTPLPGKISKIMCALGDRVAADQVLLTVESMKMENEISADHDGKVSAILIKEGDTVASNDPLIEID